MSEEQEQVPSLEDRVSWLEERIENLENVCKDGHMFQQGEDKLTNCIFCLRCGQVRRLYDQDSIKGFAQ